MLDAVLWVFCTILYHLIDLKNAGNPGWLSFLSTDTEVQITTHANIGAGDEVAGTTVAARKLLDILRALPESGDVTMTLQNKRLTVQTGKSRFALQTLAAEEFPTVQQADSYSASVTLPQKTLKHLFNMVHFSMAQQDIRYYLNGLLLVLDGRNVIAVATDGHRLAFCSSMMVLRGIITSWRVNSCSVSTWQKARRWPSVATAITLWPSSTSSRPFR